MIKLGKRIMSSLGRLRRLGVDKTSAPGAEPEKTDSDSPAIRQVHVHDTAFRVLDHWFWPEFADMQWEPQTYEVFKRYLNRDAVYVDIGTWIGPTLLYAAEIGAREIWGVEANPLTYEMVKANCEMNPSLRDAASISHWCITDHRGVISFGNENGSHGLSSASSIRGREWEVPTTTLTDYLKDNRIERIGLLKIDIEGAESMIAPDLTRLAAPSGPVIYLSLHPPFWSDKEATADVLLHAFARFRVLDAAFEPLSAERLRAMMLSDEKTPPWGTKFGNFFEVVLECAR